MVILNIVRKEFMNALVNASIKYFYIPVDTVALIRACIRILGIKSTRIYISILN